MIFFTVSFSRFTPSRDTLVFLKRAFRHARVRLKNARFRPSKNVPKSVLRHFYGTLGQKARKILFETFLRISGLGGLETPAYHYGDCDRKANEQHGPQLPGSRGENKNVLSLVE